MMYQSIPQQNIHPEYIPQCNINHQILQPPTHPQHIQQNDQYKRAGMASLVILCTFLMLAGDGMGIFTDIWEMINNPTAVTWQTYFWMGTNIWEMSTSILSLIVAIGSNMTLWSNLIIYMWICLGVGIAIQVYTAYFLITTLLNVTDPGIQEELMFFLIFAITMDILYALRQICFFRLYNRPSARVVYLMPYSPLPVKNI